MSVTPAFKPGHLVMVDIPGKSLDAETATFLRAHEIRAGAAQFLGHLPEEIKALSC